MEDLNRLIELGKFEVVLADCPWNYFGDPNKMAAAGKHYSLMQDAELLALPIPRLIAPKSVVFLWVTSSSVARACKLYEAWGLHYRGVAFDWIKTKRDGTPIGAQGVRPSITKPLTELVLVGSTVAKGRPLPLSSEKIVQTVFAPRAEHSRKPEAVQDRIDLMYPTMRKLEMFGRRQRHGWAVWGNQNTRFDPVLEACDK